MKIIAENRKAYFDFDIKEKVEGGIKLYGSEVKSVRLGRVKLAGSHVKFVGGRLQVVGLRIGVYPKAADKHRLDPMRSRDLLLQKREISKLVGLDSQKGWSVVPLKIYLKNNLVKLELGAGRFLKKYDKREKIKKREIDRQTRSVLGSG